MAGFAIALALLAVIASAVVLWFGERSLRKIEERVGQIEIRSSQLKTLQDGLRNRQDELTEQSEVSAAAESQVLKQAQQAIQSARDVARMRPQLDSLAEAQATLKEDVVALQVLLDKTRGYLQVLRSDFGSHAQSLSNVEDLGKVWSALDRHLHAFEKETDQRLESLEDATATLDTDDMEDLRGWVDRRIDDHRRSLASIEGELAARVELLERTTFSGDTLSALGRRLEVLEQKPSWQPKVSTLETVVRTELSPRLEVLESKQIEDRLKQLESRPVQGDLSPVVRVMQDSLSNLRREVGEVLKSSPASDHDLTRELEARVARLEPAVAVAAEATQERAVLLERIAHLESTSAPSVDQALIQSIEALETAATQGPAVDIEQRLETIAEQLMQFESKIRSQHELHERIEQLEKQQRSAQVEPGSVDDLKRIRGVGPRLERLLHEAGITDLYQVAAWNDEDVANFAEQLGSFGKRIERDRWVEQAQKMVADAPPAQAQG